MPHQPPEIRTTSVIRPLQWLAPCLLLLSSAAALPAAQAWTQVWSDEFNGSGLPDASKWDYEEGYIRTNETQYYTRGRTENARQEGGNLVITCRREPTPYLGVADVTSACLITQGKYEFTYGRVEARMQMPGGAGAWPAFWTLGANRRVVGKTYCGEMDILEWLANDPGTVHAALHWFDGAGTANSAGTKSGSPASGFHIYATEWFPDHIDWYYDSSLYYTVNLARTKVGGYDPFHKAHYILLNYALGPGAANWAGTPDFNALPGQFLVDYVRVSAPTGTTFNQAPTVILNPVVGSLQGDANVWVSATAADSDGSIAKVEFYDGSTLINTQNDSPQSFTFQFAAGSHSLTGKAFDNLGATTSSAPLVINVSAVGNAAPVVTMTPLSGSYVANAGTSVTLNATASDSNGSIAKVEFWKITGSAAPILLGTATSPPFSYTWNGITVGDHDIVALAWDNAGVQSCPSPGQYAKLHVTAGSNILPSVTLVAPTANAAFATAGDPLGTVITCQATANDPDGNVAEVDFLANDVVVSKVTGRTFSVPPGSTYKQDWKRVPTGVYTVKARVTDNNGGVTYSPAITITVGNPVNQAPNISTQPANQSVSLGQTATFSVAAGGSPAPTYQWYKNGAAIGGATGSSYTTPTTVSGDNGALFSVVVTNSVGSATSANASLSVTAAASTAAEINAGGLATGGFAPDQGFSGGSVTTVTTAVVTTGVANAAPPAVYQSERYGTFTYTLTGLTAGAGYNLRLHFAETYWTAAGKRVFNVAVNGTTVLANLDIFAAVGANKALVRDVPATASSGGTLTVAFTTVTDNATVSGLELLPAAHPGDADGNGVVDAVDLVIVNGQYGRIGVEISDVRADLDGNGRVDAVDLGIVTRNQGR